MSMRLLGAASAAALMVVLCPLVADAKELAELPQIDRNKPIQCLHDGDGRLWRVQCLSGVCLYAPNSEVGSDGEFTRRLERAISCYDNGPFDQQALKKQGYTLQLARADSPYGWDRDERGRVYQVVFDLHRRLYAGASWAPVFRSHDGTAAAITRASVEFGGLEIERFREGRLDGEGTRYRVALVRGQVTLAPFSADAVLLHWEMSRRYYNPLVRITTFYPGKPRRHDLTVQLGAWVEAGGLEVHHTPTGGDESLWRFATAHLTWDMWQSDALYSWVRLRGGLGLEQTYTDEPLRDRTALTPAVAIDGNLTLDRAGYHHLVAEARLENPRYTKAPPAAGTQARRAKAELAYEVIVLALNDQPISLRLASGAAWRDDIPGLEPRWAFTATAGIRVSLWAPAREP